MFLFNLLPKTLQFMSVPFIFIAFSFLCLFVCFCILCLLVLFFFFIWSIFQFYLFKCFSFLSLIKCLLLSQSIWLHLCTCDSTYIRMYVFLYIWSIFNITVYSYQQTYTNIYECMCFRVIIQMELFDDGIKNGSKRKGVT